MPFYTKVINNDVAKALRIMKKKIKEDGLLKDLAKRAFFQTKSQKRRIKKKEAVRRLKRERLIALEFERTGRLPTPAKKKSRKSNKTSS